MAKKDPSKQYDLEGGYGDNQIGPFKTTKKLNKKEQKQKDKHKKRKK